MMFIGFTWLIRPKEEEYGYVAFDFSALERSMADAAHDNDAKCAEEEIWMETGMQNESQRRYLVELG